MRKCPAKGCKIRIRKELLLACRAPCTNVFLNSAGFTVCLRGPVWERFREERHVDSMHWAQTLTATHTKLALSLPRTAKIKRWDRVDGQGERNM